METSTRMRSFQFVSLLILLTLAFHQQGWAQGQPIIFSVTGDVPYGSGEVPEFQQLMDEHDLYSPADFIVHVGDIKSGGGSCSEYHYIQSAEILESLSVPAFIVPGDNEWSDCSDEDQAWSYWMTHLFELENHFCATPGVERHPVRQELFAYVLKGVLFIGINLVGGSNDSDILQADEDWIAQQFEAKKSQVRAAVIFAQAQGKSSFESQFEIAAISFGKPVLYIHGNDHSWKYVDEYLQPNITRVVIDRGNKLPVQVTVAMTGENPFSFERNPWSASSPLYNKQPCVHAGIDQIIAQTDTVMLEGLGSDDSVPLSPGILSYSWTTVSGPGIVSFGNPSTVTTTATFSTGGTYELSLAASDGELSAADTLTVEVQAVGPSVFISDVMLDESAAGTVAIFDVSMTNPDGQDVTVNFATSDESALASLDYVAASGSLTLTDLAPSSTISVTIIGDTVYEPDETFIITLSNPTHGSIADGKGVGTILNDDLPLAPVILSFSPVDGPCGTEITITGENFFEISGVSFTGGASGPFEVDSDTQIRAIVPAEATAGPVTVTNTGGAGTSAGSFTVIFIPNITSVTPTISQAGAEITIGGFHFIESTDVTFNGVSAIFQVISDLEIRATVPTAATTGKISVIAPDGSGESVEDFRVILTPSVASFSPASGPIGAEITIFGSDFTELTGVSFGGVPTNVFEIDSEAQIRAEVPAGASTGNITVSNVAGSGPSVDAFSVTRPPTTVSFGPTDDAHVRSDKVSNNYGDSSNLQVEEDTRKRYAYFKFSVTGLAGAVQSAKIRLLVTNAGTNGGGIHLISNDYSDGKGVWTEGGLIWTNAPLISGSALSSVGAVSVGQVVEFDVTSAISGNGAYSFAIKGNAADRMDYSAKEGTQAPQLVIEALISPVPMVSSFLPANGIVGDEITINGMNFTGTTSIRINAAEASFSFVSDSELRVIVPSTASSGKIEVINADGAGESATDFTLISTPIITSFSPPEGPEGTEVTITGQNLSYVDAVAFNGKPAAGWTLVSDIELRVTVPAGASTGLIMVTNPAGQTTSGSAFTVNKIPVVSGFTPSGGLTGSAVNLSGSNFTGVTAVSFGAVAAAFTFVSDGALTTAVPATATTAVIKVTNGDGTGQSATVFSVVSAPVISSFTPTSGPPGTEVTLSGSAFTDASGVTFAATAADTFTVDSDTQLKVQVPVGASSGKIGVNNPAGSGESAVDFQVTSPPSTVTFGPVADAHVRSDKVTNNYGDASDLQVEEDSRKRHGYFKFSVSGLTGAVQSAKVRLLVTNSGSDGGGIYPVSNDYSDGSGEWAEDGLIWNNRPLISGSPLSSVGGVSAGQVVEFDVTAAISGNGFYSFAIKSAAKDRMDYSAKEGSQAPVLEIEALTIPVPVISSFTPGSGIAGTEVTITGLNLATTSSVSFGGTPAASFAAASNTQLRAVAPSGAGSGKIVVTNPDGQGESLLSFTVILPPTLTAFSPANGPVGTVVTLTGSNLAQVSSVTFNGTAATELTPVSDSEVRATAPSGASSGSITLTNPAGQTTSGSAFNVTKVPAIAGFTPGGGSAGTVVSVTGNNFDGTTAVTFGSVAAAFTFVSDSSLTATVPAAATTAKINVTNADGTGASAADFAVLSAPVITSFTPTSGPPGTEVTLSGSAFTDATEVTFSGIAAETFTVDSDTQLKVQVPVGASSGKISVANAAGTGESAADFQVTAPPSIVTFNPVEDAHVRSNRSGKNYGGSADLQVEEDTAQRHAYLKFSVSGLGGAVQSAKIRLVVTNSGSDGGGIYSVSNSYSSGSGAWTEDGLIWDNRPLIAGFPLSSTGAVSTSQVVEFDVTPAISGNGTYSFALKSGAADRMEYSSKEGSQAPVLEIEVLTSPIPLISSFSPGSGISGAEVTVTGLNLASTSAVTFAGAPAGSFAVDSNTQIRAVVPSAVGSGKIGITNADGTGESASSFTAILPPALTGFSPTNGPTSTQVTLSGANLAAVSAVSFGQTSASTFTVDSDSQIRVTVPVGAADSKISVTSLAGLAETAGVFTVTLPPAPSISGFTPASGPVGTTVTVSGQNFTGVSAVTIGGTTAVYQIDSASQIQATVVSGATTGKISITNGGGTGQSSGNFEVTQPPSIITLTPIDDSFGKSSSTSKNYGNSDELRVKFSANRVYQAYLKFEVIGVGASVQSAKLRMLVVSSSDDGGSIYLASNNFAGTNTVWEEGLLNWDNQPEILGNPISSVGQINSDEFVEFDVTAAITGDGIYTFAITNNSTDSGKYSSKEGATVPELIIETSSIATSSATQ